MLNYIRADVKRILSRPSRALSMLLLFFIYFAALYFPNRSAQVTSVSLISSACNAADWILALVALFEMIAIFSEDFKVKTMQVAIGLGLTRTRVVLCKLAEAVILLVLDCIVLLALTLGIGSLFDVVVPAAVLNDLIIVLLVKGLLGNATYIALTMIVLFSTQSTILAIFVFILVAIGTLNGLLTLAPMLGFDWLENLRISHITLYHLLSAFHTRLTLGTFDFVALIGVLVHLAAGVFITCKLFAKRELDF